MSKITYIDVGSMSFKEACEVTGYPYTPWYRSSFFWIAMWGLSPVWIMPLMRVVV